MTTAEVAVTVPIVTFGGVGSHLVVNVFTGANGPGLVPQLEAICTSYVVAGVSPVKLKGGFPVNVEAVTSVHGAVLPATLYLTIKVRLPVGTVHVTLAEVCVMVLNAKLVGAVVEQGLSFTE